MEGNDLFYIDNVRIDLVSATTTTTTSALWLSTTGNVGTSGAPGLSAWENGEVIQLGDPNLAFEPGTTDGTFSSALNLETLAGTNIDVDALFSITGNGVDTYHGFTKILWIRENEPENYARIRHVPSETGATFELLLPAA